VLDRPHGLTDVVVANGEVRHLQPTPTCLLVRDRQALCGAHNLAHPRVAEEARMYGCRLTRLRVARTAQREDAHIRPVRGGAHDLPRLLAANWPPPSSSGVFTREEQRLAIRQVVLLHPLDLIPDFIPIVGNLDDLILVPIGIALALKLVPATVIADCRARAQADEGRPVSRVGAAFIIAVWLLVAAFGFLFVRNLLAARDLP